MWWFIYAIQKVNYQLNNQALKLLSLDILPKAPATGG
jgi:hypothetical protein